MSTTRPRATKQYKALMAIPGLTDERALEILGVTAPAEPEVDSRLAGLIAGGFTEEQATKILADQDGGTTTKAERKAAKKAKHETVAEPATELTDKQRAEALVAQQGLAFTKGRVYASPTLAEAIVRVHKGAGPEVIKASGVGRTAAVLVYREDSGDVALQNLAKPV